MQFREKYIKPFIPLKWTGLFFAKNDIQRQKEQSDMLFHTISLLPRQKTASPL